MIIFLFHVCQRYSFIFNSLVNLKLGYFYLLYWTATNSLSIQLIDVFVLWALYVNEVIFFRYGLIETVNKRSIQVRFLVSNLITYLTHNAFCLQRNIFIFIRCFLKQVLILTPHVGDAILGTYPICALGCNFITILSRYQCYRFSFPIKENI